MLIIITMDSAKIVEIIQNGSFYAPASKNYGKDRGEITVVCDRCDDKDILACIGYEEYDLCILCV